MKQSLNPETLSLQEKGDEGKGGGGRGKAGGARKRKRGRREEADVVNLVWKSRRPKEGGILMATLIYQVPKRR